ncbi:MAG: PIN domain-containing protein [Pirellulales bacterium]
MKVFIDTNVLLDVIADRKPFYGDSAAVWTLAEERRIEGCVSAISFTNIFYVVRKLVNGKTARRALGLMRDAFSVVACDGRILSAAMDSDLADFEDAVQYASARHVRAKCMVTRNPGDFPRQGACPVLTPAEFLAAHDVA